jgi:lysine 2,3-aminomutase
MMFAVEPETGDAGAPSWRAELAAAYTDVESLVRAGLVSEAEAARLLPIAATYQLSLPRYYAGLIDRAALTRCPIRRQALPSLNEVDPVLPPWAEAWSLRAFGRSVPWSPDAIGDVAKLGAPRLTHRYVDRAIVHVSPACALYCRFCFRKSHLNSSEAALYRGSLEPALGYIAATPAVHEMILTGGDPLSVPDAWLGRFLSKIEAIPHVRRVRLHSRMAVTLPARLTPGLEDALADRRFGCALVSHFNHPRELTPVALGKLERLRRRGVTLYNQAVLLAGVNDDANTLRALFQGLYDAGITPFYLHHPDWTPGTFHFRTPIARGQALMAELAGRLSGPAMPHYVLDTPQGGGKVHLLHSTCRRLDGRDDPHLGGALYQFSLPHTRDGSGRSSLYIDLYPQ